MCIRDRTVADLFVHRGVNVGVVVVAVTGANIVAVAIAVAFVGGRRIAVVVEAIAAHLDFTRVDLSEQVIAVQLLQCVGLLALHVVRIEVAILVLIEEVIDRGLCAIQDPVTLRAAGDVSVGAAARSGPTG